MLVAYHLLLYSHESGYNLLHQVASNELSLEANHQLVYEHGGGPSMLIKPLFQVIM